MLSVTICAKQQHLAKVHLKVAYAFEVAISRSFADRHFCEKYSLTVPSG